MENSTIEMEIKKDQLKKHLQEVEKLIDEWRPQLHAQRPFRISDSDIWPINYKPALEQDPDYNHMLRKHIHSRAFWTHHADWERIITAIYETSSALLKTANDFTDEIADRTPHARPNYMFERVALNDAFTWCAHRKFTRKYKPEQRSGVRCGAYLIEEAASPQEVGIIEKLHIRLITMLKDSEPMKELIGNWKEAQRPEVHMHEIIDRIIKSGDFIFSCRFCKKLLRA